MGFQAREGNGLIKFFIMAFQTCLLGREYLFGIILMAMKTGGFFNKEYLVFLMIELDCQGRYCKKDLYN